MQKLGDQFAQLLSQAEQRQLDPAALTDFVRYLNEFQRREEIYASWIHPAIPKLSPFLTRSEGLSSISPDLGLMEAGEFRAGNGLPPGQGFSGTRLAYPALSYGGSTYHIVGVSNDVLQFGLDATTGKAVAGAGSVTLDGDGVTFDVGTDVSANPNAIKWNLLGTEYYRIVGATVAAFLANQLEIIINKISGKYSQMHLIADSVTETISGSESFSAIQLIAEKDGVAKAAINVVGYATAGLSNVQLQSDVINIGSHTTDKIGFYTTGGVAKQTVTGSRGANAALASLLTALANLGLITDSSS